MERDALLGLIRNRLANSVEVGALDIIVEIVDGTVRLSGEVDSRQQREAAAGAVHELAGVHSVINDLVVREMKRPDGHHQMIISAERGRR
ncbi:MAG: BON domain-containing protein [bacterium]|nr:BON domain-containing protein [bacterium]